MGSGSEPRASARGRDVGMVDTAPEPVDPEPAFLTSLTAKAGDRRATTSLRLVTVLNVLSSTPARANRRAPRIDGPLTHFRSPPGEKSGLASGCGRLRLTRYHRP